MNPPDRPSVQICPMGPNVNPMIGSVAKQFPMTIVFNLDLVGRDYGIKRENFVTQAHYSNAILDWMYQVWAALPSGKAEMYAAYSANTVSETRDFHQEMVIHRLRMLIRRYQDMVVINLDLVARDYGVKQEDYETQLEYKEVIDCWWLEVWLALPKEKASTYTVYSPLSQGSYQHPITPRNIYGLHIDRIRRDSGIRREQFRTMVEYLRAKLNWLNNVWARMPPKEAQKYALFSSHESYEESIFQNVKDEFRPNLKYGYQKMIGLHVERICRDYRLDRDHFISDASFLQAIVAWWENVHNCLESEEKERYSIQNKIF